MVSLAELLNNDKLDEIDVLISSGEVDPDEFFYEEWEKYMNRCFEGIEKTEKLYYIAMFIIICGKYNPPKAFYDSYEYLKEIVIINNFQKKILKLNSKSTSDK